MSEELTAEQTAREAADAALSEELTAEQTAREAADAALSEELTNEIVERKSLIVSNGSGGASLPKDSTFGGAVDVGGALNVYGKTNLKKNTVIDGPLSANDGVSISGDLKYGTIEKYLNNDAIKILTDDGHNAYLKVVTSRGESEMIGFVNVMNYGASGDGVSDDYEAFLAAVNDTGNGDYIIVPQGTYYLSKNPYSVSDKISSVNPSDFTMWRNWIIASGVNFTGAGVGDVLTGKGTFRTPFVSNPWLVVAGENQLYNLNGITANVQNGAILGDSKELAPISSDTHGASHKWYCLEYRGTCTGNTASTALNVELLNQVMNITGCKGIIQEINLNNYSDNMNIGWNCALFITGGGSGKSSMEAIEITRDSDSENWDIGVSIHKADSAIAVTPETVTTAIGYGDQNAAGKSIINGIIQKNGDGLILKCDSGHTGNFIRFLDSSGNVIFRVDTNGYAYAKGWNTI